MILLENVKGYLWGVGFRDAVVSKAHLEKVLSQHNAKWQEILRRAEESYSLRKISPGPCQYERTDCVKTDIINCLFIQISY